MTNLSSLDLNENQTSDISLLVGLTNLTELSLGDNQISDISSLAGLSNLRELLLGSNQISDISPLVANAGLASGDLVDLQGNPLSATSINLYIPQLQARGVTVYYIIWDCPLGGVTLIAPYPIHERPYITMAVDPAEIMVVGGALWGIYYLDETSGEWLYFIPSFTGSTLTQLEPDEFYLVVVSGACSLSIPQ
ncbi:leucine-rich repeat domain-containing protein [Chloroflexota bacterium]